MKVLTFALFASLAAASASAEVSVTLNDGRVSIVAKDATVRQILTEWARVGQTKIVNVERIPGGPMTIELTNVPEGQALDTLLRNVSGYMAAPRATAEANMSVFDRVIVMPTTVAPRAPVTSQAPPPVFQPQQAAQQAPAPNDDADDPPAPPAPGAPRAPVFNSFPPPQAAPQVQPTPAPNPQAGFTSRPGQVAPQPQPQQTPGTVPAQQPVTYPGTPTAPPAGGVAVPGMIVAPQSPNGQPVRRPGGGDRQ
jgi:hypothetical protein